MIRLGLPAVYPKSDSEAEEEDQLRQEAGRKFSKSLHESKKNLPRSLSDRSLRLRDHPSCLWELILCWGGGNIGIDRTRSQASGDERRWEAVRYVSHSPEVTT